MIKRLIAPIIVLTMSISIGSAEYDYYRTLLDLTDTLGGVVQGNEESGWQNKPHGVVVLSLIHI